MATAPAIETPQDIGVRKSATFLFTDIVGSTEKLTLLGEETWLRALRAHNAVVQDVVDLLCTHDHHWAQFDGGRIANLKGLGPHLVFGVDWAA